MSSRLKSKPRVDALRVEHLINPLGLDEPRPRFSWRLNDPRIGAGQTAWQIEVSAGDRMVWDSGRVESPESVLVPYEGARLRAHTRYHWRVRVWDHTGEATAWSEPAWFETGFLSPKTPWPAAEWIAHPALPKVPADRPAAQLRKSFRLDAAPWEARLYITARGIFEPWLNGERVGRDHLAPGWTDYRRRFEYLSYDVTSALRAGENTLSALLADGWYCGWLGFKRMRDHYGDTPALLAVLRIVEEDGTVRWIGSDGSWRASTGPILNADLYDGETFDARLSFGEKERPARVLSFPWLPLAGKAFGRVRTIEELAAVKLTRPAKGRHVFDFGQNIVGNIRLRVRAPRGTRITLRYAEMLEADGTLYTKNYRQAKSTDVYVCRGGGPEVYEPRFTFHGFRYVEISGVKAAPSIDAVTGLVWHSEMTPTGVFECSDPLVNKLQSNIRWGQRGNFLEIPTDCPQRDERLGWTGDAQVFIPTATFNYDVAAFFRKWARDVVDGQHATGAYPDTAPDLFFNLWPLNPGANAAWAEAGIICPWVVYRKYGDKRILEENYPSMTRYLAHLEKISDKLIRPDTRYGDWLSPEATRPDWAATPCDLIGTAYFARSAELLAKIASVLGRAAEARRHAALHRRIVAAFNRHYVTADARLAGDTQTAYLLALGFDLLPPAKRPAALAHLERVLKRRNYHLCTGFVGTPLLCPVLSRFGRFDLAYRLLFNDDYPSWLYPVKNGATTMWERWNSWTPENGFGDANMNSFNHYAYGAIGEWLYSTVGGIEELAPAFRSVLLRPKPSKRLKHARAELESPYGRIRSAWRRGRDGKLDWEIEVPPGVGAVAVPPAPTLTGLRIDGAPWRGHAGVAAAIEHEGRPALRLRAGRYRLTLSRAETVD